MLTEALRLGGGETVAITLANALSERGLTVACAAADGPLRERLSHKVTFLPIPEFSYACIGKVAAALRTIIKNLRPDIVHAHGSTLSFLAGLSIQSLRAQIPNVLTRHNPFSRVSPSVGCMLLSRFCDHVIVLSHIAYNQFCNPFFPPRRISVIPNFIDVAAAQAKLASIDRQQVRAMLQIPEAIPVVIIVGRLIPGKRCDMFIRAVARTAKRMNTRICGLIVGDGPLRQELETLARAYGDQVVFKFLGYRPDVYTYLAVSDAFLFPTASEVLPLVLLEASVAGVPIICSDIPQNKNIIEHGVTGIVVPGDEVAFSDALVSLLQDSAAARQRAEKARQRAEQRFDKNVVLDQTIALYEQLIHEKQASLYQ